MLHRSLRVRYEAFSAFANAVNRAASLNEVGESLAVHSKYVLDLYLLRFCYVYQDQAMVIEVSRGKAKLVQDTAPALLHAEEVGLLADQLPRYLEGAHWAEFRPRLAGTLFSNAKVCSLYSLPLQPGQEQQLVMTVASKSEQPYSEPDFRFTRLMAELLASKLSQLQLLQDLERKNEELAEANHELQTLNDEVQRLNLYLEDTVASRTEALHKANEELSTLFYRSSHDFRRPLTTILGLVNVARQLTVEPELHQLFGYSEDTVAELMRMLEKLKDLSHWSQEEQETAEVDFSALLERIEARFASQLIEKGISLQTTVQAHHPYIAHSGAVYSLLENLVENAVFFSATAPWIRVSIKQQGTYLHLEVEDNGQGIPVAYQPRVFDMYYRANEYSKGNGMGLYVVKKLSEKLGGTVRLCSLEGKGTTVEVQLPYQR